MDIFSITSILVTLCAVFGYLNLKFLKLPTVIGIMVQALVFSVLILLMPYAGMDITYLVSQFMNQIDFSQTLLEGMLSFLLFAGALHVKLENLKAQKWIVSLLAGFGTLFSAALAGGTAYVLFPYFGFDIPLIYALLFGALIAPTDPVAVMAILKKAGVSKSLETKVVGESLFNDGIAVVIFIVLL
ncbi:MAG: cation:proton antiporter, partial [Rickettsiales bacterium]